jgi:hypothetical protein
MRLSILVLLLTGCAGAGAAGSLQPSATVTTTSPASENIFRVDWSVATTGPNARRIEGYVHNTYGVSAARVQMLGQALDASGNLVGQRLVWVPGSVPQFGRSYFTIDPLPPADHYRVTVWAFDLEERPGGDPNTR